MNEKKKTPPQWRCVSPKVVNCFLIIRFVAAAFGLVFIPIFMVN